MKNKFTRRKFLDYGSKGLMASVALPAFLSGDIGKIFESQERTDMKLQDYYERFHVDEKLIQEIIDTALSRGGDYCDLFFEHTIANSIGLEDREVNRAATSISIGMGVRVLSGDSTGFSFTEELTPKSMRSAALTAANIAATNAKVKSVEMKLYHPANYYPIQTPWEDVGIDKKIPYLQTINEKVFAEDKRIIKSNMSFSNSTSYVLIASSEGTVTFDYQPLSQISVSVIAEQNGKREQNYFDLAGRYGIEFFSDKNVNRLATEPVRKAVALFDAVKPEPGEMEVVLAAGSSGILLHEAIGHGMEADFNRKNISIFADKLNKPVAQNFVNIVDDGTNPSMRGSINIDDEGNPSQKTFLVENGILRSYLHDRISAQYYKTNPTGNGRRQSFRYAPMPRMRNTYMLPGPHTKEEIIASVKKGIYAETFTNGQVFIGAGDFTFYVKSGYLIENGQLTKPIKDINIIGNGPKVLSDIVMVGNDLTMAEGGWTCGKNGQGVPVSMGLPTVKVSKITVGGVRS